MRGTARAFFSVSRAISCLLPEGAPGRRVPVRGGILPRRVPSPPRCRENAEEGGRRGRQPAEGVKNGKKGPLYQKVLLSLPK